jgi:excisionase family DNA binding protein
MTASVRYKLNELLRVEDVAEKLGISLKTVRSWIYLKKVPFTRLGRRVYFSVTVIEQMLNSNSVKPLVPSASQ